MRYAAVAVAAAIPVLLGVLVLAHGSGRRIGWLLVAHGISVGLLLGGAGSAGQGHAARVVDQLAQGSWIFLFLWLVLIAYLLPDGRPLSAHWRHWMGAGLLGAALFLVGAAGDASSYRQEHAGAAPPVRWLPQAVSDVIGTAGLVLVVLLFFGSVVAVWQRLKRATDEARRQLLWVIWGALAVPVGLLCVWANHFLLGDHDWLTTVALTWISVAMPVAIAVAIRRHRLLDIELVLSRTLTYGVLVVGVVVLYALLLRAAERVGGDGTVGGLIAVAVVAVSVHPTYSWLRRHVERWVYGYRSEPHRAMRLLADRAESAEAEQLSAMITAAVAEAVRVDRVWVDPTPGPGDEQGERILRVPLVHRGETLGDLVVEAPPGRHLSQADVALLGDLARYAAVLVQAEARAVQLRQSRTRIVAAREEERRRLRRDLHDGLGPALAAIVLKLNAAESRQQEARAELLAEARKETRQAIVEVRRLVDDLRPAAIDEVGLLGAIRQRAATLSDDLVVEVEGPETMPRLPAAVEVAAFRITSEALTNVVRHAGATRCRISISTDGPLELTVADNGCGAAYPGVPGVGWISMRERAAEVGGSCTIAARPEGGLLVRALLPLGQPTAAGQEAVR
jgi:signal transduction histidine kinase